MAWTQGKTGTITFQSTPAPSTYAGGTMYLDWSEQYDTSTNKHKLTFGLRAMLKNNAGVGYLSCLLKAGGQTLLNVTALHGEVSSYFESEQTVAMNYGGSPWSATITIDGNTDGTASFVASLAKSGTDGFTYPAIVGGTVTRDTNFAASTQTVLLTTIARKHTLTITQGTHTTITVKRNGSTITSGTAIYDGDVLTITFGVDTGYNLSTHTVNGSTFTSGNTHTVSGDVKVVSSATAKQYTLSMSQGANTSVVVKRGTTTLSSGATVYYGDQLVITFNAATGYSLATHTVNGSTFTSGNTHTVTGNVSVAATATQATYTLTKNAAANTTITVKKNGTTYTGSSLNYGDVLTITFSASSGTTLTGHTVNGATFTSGGTYTVKGNVTIATTATATPYNLSITQGSNATVTVMRGSAQLSDGAIVAYGDVLKITFSASSGYALTIHTVNGSPFVSGSNYTVTGDVAVNAAAATIGALTQPTNISPDEVNNTGTVDAEKALRVSWQVNGNVAMTAFRIVIYQNDAASTQMYSTGKIVLDTPFWGHNYKGETQFYTRVITAATLASRGIVNGGEYKLTIEQWWSDSDSIKQSTASVFVARATPTLTVSYAGADELEQFFDAVYSQAEGAPLNWVRWQIYETDSNTLVYDTGEIAGTGELRVGYSGMVPDTQYRVEATIQTVNGVTATADMNYTVQYDNTYPFSGDVEVCQRGTNSVNVSWPVQTFATKYYVARREIGKSYIQPIAVLTPAVGTDTVQITDYGAASTKTYEYSVFPINAEDIIFAPATSNPITVRYWKWEIVEAHEISENTFVIDAVHFFRIGSGGVSEGGFSNNNNPSLLKNFTRYPVRQAETANYLTGSISGYIGTIDTTSVEYIDTIEQSDTVFALSNSTKTLFLLDPEGHFLNIHVSSPIQMTVSTKTLPMQKTMTIPWVEIGSTDGVVLLASAPQA